MSAAPKGTSRRRRRRGAGVLALVLLAAACTDDAGPVLGSAEVVPGEVVQTVAAAAELEAAGRATVTAPAGGTVVELLVADGDVVAQGDPLVRIESDAIDGQIEQAEAAVEAAAALADAAAGAGVDLAPVVEAFGAQLDAVFPPLLGALRDQLDALDGALTELTVAADDLVGSLPSAPPVGATLPKRLPTPEPPSITLPDPTAARAAIDDARARVAEAEHGYREASAQLRSAEAGLAAQADQAVASQVAVARAQRQQAERALAAARSRIEDLTVVAPVAGVVELARTDGAPSAGGPLPDLAGSFAADGELGDLLGGGAAGTGVASSGPLEQGSTVVAGQALLSVFDLSSFTARVLVDEIDIVEVVEDQAVVVLVDAFPRAELEGVVTRVALTPLRQVSGGSSYEVTVELRAVPDDVRLRIGLTASAEIEVRRVEGDTVVPTSALLRRGGDEVVTVVRDGRAVQTPVQVVAIGDESAAVEGDVRVGEVVVTTGVELLEDGDVVDLGP